ncbi:MAG: hypothetical protein IJ801_03595 [Lachnospiraceae bacterium]|nr:hypothetical protein [Lachnospiraceae bacterium]
MKKHFFERCMAILLIFNLIFSFFSVTGNAKAAELSTEDEFVSEQTAQQDDSVYYDQSEDASGLSESPTQQETTEVSADDTEEEEHPVLSSLESNTATGDQDAAELANDREANRQDTDDEASVADSSIVSEENASVFDTNRNDSSDWRVNESEEKRITIIENPAEPSDSSFDTDTLLEEELLLKNEENGKEQVGYIIADRAWASGHYVWYVDGGSAGRHYIFCMEKGKMMRSNLFRPSKYSGTFGTPQNTFRIAVAMHYFRSHGGWSSENGYVDTQYAIWNEGQTREASALITYANYLWKLTEKNPGRTAGSSSYSSHLTAVRESNVSSKEQRTKLSAGTYKLKKATSDSAYSVKSTIALSGSAWKYFAKGGSGEWSSAAPGIHGRLSVSGCYAPDGSRLTDDIISASLGTDGALSVKLNQVDRSGSAIATSKDNAILIVMKAEQDYSGASSIEYLDSGRNVTQMLSYDANYNSPAYFAIKVYKPSNMEEQQASLTVYKVDEFGKPVEGAEFELRGQDTKDQSIKGLPVTLTASDNTYTFTTEGAYQLEETKAPYGMKRLGVISSMQTYMRQEGNVNKLYIEPRYTADSVNAVSTDDGISYTYTVTNTYLGGSAYLKKAGQIFTAYENGEFIYQERALENVSFQLYAGEEICAGETLLFSNDQLITQELLDQSVWNTVGKHAAVIDTATDSDGLLYFRNLPPGCYYIVESENPYNGYGVSGTRMEFTILPDKMTPIQEGTYYNHPIYANCMAIKTDSENPDKRLAGAEFTLYAHIGNTNFEGDPLFHTEDTRPAVVSRQNGIERTEEHTWIPLDTVVSDTDGQAMFTMKLPYGTYMVVETHAPDGYALCEESYQFTHTFDSENTYASGALFAHTFGDTEQSNLIVIRKTGEVLASAATVQTDYGSYEQLQFQPFAVRDVVFEIYDAEQNLVDTVRTNQEGIATIRTLSTGQYNVKEIDNGGSLKLDSEDREVELKRDATAIVQSKTVEFMNESLSTRFRIYKQGEKAVFTTPVENVSQADSLYTYPVEALSDVVFAVYTREDIQNVEGKVIVKADSCMGYCVTNAQGIATLDEKLCNGSYYYKEIRTADETYLEDTEQYNFNVKLDGVNLTEDLNADQPIINRKCRGRIRVIKTDGSRTIFLPGVAFLLYDAGQNLLGTFLTDQEGKIEISQLPLGTYYIKESRTLENYVLDDTMYQVDLTRTESEQTLQLQNQEHKENVTEEASDVQDSDQTNTEKKKEKVVIPSNHTKTGDISHLRMICFLFVLAMTGFVILYQVRKGGNQCDDNE